MAKQKRDQSDWDLTEDADTGMRAEEDILDQGDIDQDRKRLFPENQDESPPPGTDSADFDVEE
jgi:hypothetical protein